MTPGFDPPGFSATGGSETTLAEIDERLGFNHHRRRLVQGLRRAIRNLKAAGVQRVWVDGSFVTSKPKPGDVDGCWDPTGVDPAQLDPVLLDFDNSGAAMKARYGVDFFPNVVEGASGKVFYRFFQYDRNQHRRGILLLKPGGEE